MHPDLIEADRDRIIEFDYVNHAGLLKHYRVIPHTIYFGRTSYIKQDEWLLNATVIDRNVVRHFVLINLIGVKK